MYTNEGEMILSMERFTPLLKDVECDDHMILSFKNKASFEHAIRAWDWVNEDETHSFIMIANHPKCEPEDRAPYYILDADYDEENNIAHLYGERKTMKEIAHTADVDIGTAQLPDDPTIQSRGEASKGFSVSTEFDYAGPLVSHTGDTWPSFSIECESCGTTGHIAAEGRLSWGITGLDDVSVSFSMAGFGGYADWKFNMHGTLPASIYYVNKIGKCLEPGYNFFVVKAVWTVCLQYGVSLGSFTGNLTVSSGAGLHLPESAEAELKIYPDLEKDLGYWVPEGYVKPLSFDGEIDGATLSVFTQIFGGVTFGIDVFAWEKQVGAGLTFKPLNLDLIMEKDDDCDVASVTPKWGSVFGAFIGDWDNTLGISIPGPGSQKRGLGGAMTWVFWKGIWGEPDPFCIDKKPKEKRQDALALEKGGVPHVRRGTGFFGY